MPPKDENWNHRSPIQSTVNSLEQTLENKIAGPFSDFQNEHRLNYTLSYLAKSSLISTLGFTSRTPCGAVNRPVCWEFKGLRRNVFYSERRILRHLSGLCVRETLYERQGFQNKCQRSCRQPNAQTLPPTVENHLNLIFSQTRRLSRPP